MNSDLYRVKSRAIRAGIGRWSNEEIRLHQRWLDEKSLKEPFNPLSLSANQRELLEETLKSLRLEAEATGVLRYHQILAHFDVCFTLGLPAKRWELSELAVNLEIPKTPFFIENEHDIIATVEDDFCLGFVLENGNAQLGKMMKHLDENGAFFTGHRRRAIPRSIAIIDCDGQIVIPDMDVGRKLDFRFTGVHLPWRYIAELEDVIPSRALFHYLRSKENDLRKVRNLPEVGAGWISESLLFSNIAALLPEREVIQHGQPSWLGRQHLDVYVPSLNLGFEYQGIQHFEPVEFFGGEDAFESTRERDLRKRRLCEENNTTLITIKHDAPLSKAELELLLDEIVKAKNIAVIHRSSDT